MTRTQIKKIVIALLALGAVAVMGTSFACLSIPEELGLREGRLLPCPDSPNCVCSEEAALASSIAPLAYSGGGTEAMDALFRFLQAEPGVEVVTAKPYYIHAVYRTTLLRFRDDVEFRLDEAEGVIQVRSASRVGYSDLGTNRERIDGLRARWSSDQVD